MTSKIYIANVRQPNQAPAKVRSRKTSDSITQQIKDDIIQLAAGSNRINQLVNELENSNS